MSCAACGTRDYMKPGENVIKVTLDKLPAIYVMTAAQRLEIAELPILILFDVQGDTRRQALPPVFSCFPEFRNITEMETVGNYKEFIINDPVMRYHLHAYLVLAPEVFIYICSIWNQAY